MGMKLFDDSSDDDDVAKISEIEIDKEFARRYEHNKKREDLQRFEELEKKGLAGEESGSDSESSSEDFDLGKNDDLTFFDALIRVKNNDPVIENKDVKLFESEFESDSEEESGETEEEEEGLGRRKKEKPMYLKDVTAKLLIEEGPEFEERDENEKVKSYADEQEELKKAFLDAVEEAMDDEEGELLKEKGNEGDEDEGDSDDGIEIQNKLDEYFGEDDKLDENEKFLKDYFRNKMWVDESKGQNPLDEVVFGVSDDEEEIEKQEDYEKDFNFRFEEKAGDRVLGHSRFVEGSVRKKENARKTQRKSKEERMAQAELERKEELKRLKNLKKKEMNERLRKIRETAGLGEDMSCPLDVDDLEKEFDPEDYDRKMKEAFDDDYYEANDVDAEFGSEDDSEAEKPDFDKEDELLGLPKGWDDVSGSRDGFIAARERTLKRKVDSGTNNEQVGGEELVPEDGKQKKKQKMSSLEKEVLEKELEEYYKLDYEDTIEDLKTRFKYKEVNPQKFGLSAEAILMTDDKELNQFVSLKKLAPYMEKEWKVPRSKVHNLKQRNKLVLEEEKLNGQKIGKRTSKDNGQRMTTVTGAAEHGKAQLEESNDDMSKLSRRSKRRRRQAEFKLSQSRLLAYGKIPSKPKNKRK
ncbi:uncharacterized protein LOC132295171 [Cornus florida]|uniref:uncharacterized protein LOC132295171 n=1 Tax=Cornus florida TaxID=4283 RepID=UPI002897F14E|nr:uncharacterized protein LOC132295171 [Cornus florida]